MPAGLPPTPWIRSYDTPQMYLGGVHAGAAIGEANARIAAESQRLQQQANQGALEMQLQQQQLEQKSRLEQQQLEIAKAYHEAQIGMAQNKLREVQRMNDLKVAQASRQVSLQPQIEMEMAQEMAQDPSLDEGTARFRVASRHYGDLGLPPAAAQRMITAGAEMSQRTSQAEMVNRLNQARLQAQQQKQAAAIPEGIVKQYTAAQANIRSPALEAALQYPKTEAGKSAKAQLDKSQRIIDAFEKKYGITLPEDTTGKKPLDKINAMWFMNEAGGDRKEAERMAKEAGFTF